MMNLSADQTTVVEAPIGIAIQVLASAGSGKTRVLTERVRYILENTRSDSVIAITFTNKAADEMKQRLSDFEDIDDRCWIATIHSLSQRIIGQYGHTIGLPSELHIFERDEDKKTLLLQALHEMKLDIDSLINTNGEITQKERNQIIQKYLNEFSIIKRELLTKDEIIERYIEEENFVLIYEAYQDALLQSDGMDYDDILVYAHQILSEQPWCGRIYRAKYKHICLDEAQDLNKAQYEVVKALCSDEVKSVMMVGDPNQMIYGFNGSSSDYLCHFFLEDFSPKKYKLDQNYRSTRKIIKLANKLKPNSQVESDFALQGKARIKQFPDEEAEATWVCKKITQLLDLKTHPDIEGEIVLNKMVVLGRNGFVFNAIKEKLDEEQIPYSLNRGESQVEPESIFGKVLNLGIKVRLNSKNWIDGKKLCLTLGIPEPHVWESQDVLTTLARSVKDSKVPFLEIQSELLSAIQGIDLDKPNIPKLVNHFSQSLKNLPATSEQKDIDELERSLLELQRFDRCWTVFKKKGLGESLGAFRNAMALRQLTEEFIPNGLTLSTVHTMKGLEKDIVFLVGMCEGVFPDYRADTKKEIDEELNSAFVAVTRSRRWLCITYPLSRMMPWGSPRNQTPSRFIKQMES